MMDPPEWLQDYRRDGFAVVPGALSALEAGVIEDLIDSDNIHCRWSNLNTFSR